MTRMKVQLTPDRARLLNQMECLLEEMRIKLSIVVSNLLGASGLRILRALADGEAEPRQLAQ
jgi:transposase